MTLSKFVRTLKAAAPGHALTPAEELAISVVRRAALRVDVYPGKARSYAVWMDLLSQALTAR